MSALRFCSDSRRRWAREDVEERRGEAVEKKEVEAKVEMQDERWEWEEGVGEEGGEEERETIDEAGEE